MRVGQVARAAGVSVQTVRFYERRGLLPAPRRLRSGYRDYAVETVSAVLRIKQMQELGFTLRELTHFMRLLETEPQNYPERRACVEAKLHSIDEQIERLRSMRGELSTRLRTCECCNASSESSPIKPQARGEKE
ncbi:MAG TPA: MerR family transcriptional regulator [Blastocatellia bacterium]|nr:MerR family transcriptional regulator [Blastocatellia bacterium]